MKKIRVISAVLLVIMLFSSLSTSAFAIQLSGGIAADLSEPATGFTAINAEGWDTDNLTLNGVPYAPFITERGYMLVRNGELIQAAVAPEVAKKLGLNLAKEFIITDAALMDSRITPELLEELAKIIEEASSTLEKEGAKFWTVIEDNGDLIDANTVVDGLTSGGDIKTIVENFLNQIEVILYDALNDENGLNLHDYLMANSPRYAEIYQILQEGNYAPQVEEELGKIDAKQSPVELALTDGKNVMTFLCKNLASASNPYDQTYPCTGCGCDPCVCLHAAKPDVTSPPV